MRLRAPALIALDELLDLSALELARAARQDEFAKALCKKSRLGKFLPLPKRS